MIRRLLAMLCLLLAMPALAQEPQPDAQQGEATPAAITAQIEQIKADAGLADELRTSLLETLGKALEAAKAAEAQAAKTQQFAADKQDAPNKLQKVKDDLKNYVAPAPPAPEQGARTTAELEPALAASQQAHKDAAQAVADHDTAQARRAERRTQVPARLAEVRKALDALPTQIADPALDPRLLAARNLANVAEHRRLQAEQGALQAELDAYEATSELKSAQRDLAARDAAARKTVADAWQTIVQTRRVEEAKQAQEKARREAVEALPLFKDLANDNAAIASKLPDLAEAQKDAENDLAAASENLKVLERDFAATQERARLGSAAIGPLLRQQRTQLPTDSREQRRLIRALQQRLEQAQLHYLQFLNERRNLTANLDQRLAEAERTIADEWQRTFLIARAKTMLDERLANLRTLSDGWYRVQSDLYKLEAEQQRLLELSDAYRDFVNERVLWIRSSVPIWRLSWSHAVAAAQWLGEPAHWLGLLGALAAAVIAEPWQLLPVLAGLGCLLLRRLLLRRLRVHAVTVHRGQNVAYTPTTLALLDTLLLALPVPVLLWLLAVRLSGNLDCSESTELFARAVAAGANQSAVFLALLLLIGWVVRQDGLGEAHFQWRVDGLTVLRRCLPLLLPVAFPLIFALGMLEQRADDDWLGSLGLLLLVPVLLLLLVCFWRVLHPLRGVAGGLGQLQSSWVRRFRSLWFLLGVGTPLALLALALLGYEFTAMQLARRLEYTVAVVLAGALVHGLIARGLVLVRRRLSIQLLKARLAAAKSGSDTATVDAGEAAGSDPSKLTRQTQTLLYGAVSLVVVLLSLQFWVDVLPALGVLKNVRLWGDSSVDPPIVISLADLLLALLLLLATALAARNLPGLLELLVLQRLRVQAGERNAITTLARYLLVIIGLVASFSAIGIGWSKVQWLIAAVSVGLGFGLQEIFANFVSGLILLFERQVRVGDVVTVGTVTGRVSRIRIRATTIQDWDRKELVVPNREFVTNQFVNWTLTDSVVRFVTKVGVAYGTDTGRAMQLLQQAAVESQYVLREPAPRAVFTGFGDSVLDLELRLYVDNLDNVPDLQNDVNQRIARLFQQHNIEIAFPQRDLHLRSAGPLVEFLRRDVAAEEP